MPREGDKPAQSIPGSVLPTRGPLGAVGLPESTGGRRASQQGTGKTKPLPGFPLTGHLSLGPPLVAPCWAPGRARPLAVLPGQEPEYGNGPREVEIACSET